MEPFRHAIHLLFDCEAVEAHNIRAHVLYMQEYTPLFVLILSLAEANGLAGPFVHLFGVIFIVARVFHIEMGLMTGVIRWRVVGMLLTLSSITAASLYNLYSVVLKA